MKFRAETEPYRRTIGHTHSGDGTDDEGLDARQREHNYIADPNGDIPDPFFDVRDRKGDRVYYPHLAATASSDNATTIASDGSLLLQTLKQDEVSVDHSDSDFKWKNETNLCEEDDYEYKVNEEKPELDENGKRKEPRMETFHQKDDNIFRFNVKDHIDDDNWRGVAAIKTEVDNETLSTGPSEHDSQARRDELNYDKKLMKELKVDLKSAKCGPLKRRMDELQEKKDPIPSPKRQQPDKPTKMHPWKSTPVVLMSRLPTAIVELPTAPKPIRRRLPTGRLLPPGTPRQPVMAMTTVQLETRPTRRVHTLRRTRFPN